MHSISFLFVVDSYANTKQGINHVATFTTRFTENQWSAWFFNRAKFPKPIKDKHASAMC
jgi:hypothetical protein